MDCFVNVIIALVRRLSIFLKSRGLSVFLSICLSVCLSFCHSVCLSVRPCLSIRPSVHPSIHPSHRGGLYNLIKALKPNNLRFKFKNVKQQHKVARGGEIQDGKTKNCSCRLGRSSHGANLPRDLGLLCVPHVRLHIQALTPLWKARGLEAFLVTWSKVFYKAGAATEKNCRAIVWLRCCNKWSYYW